ncbi:MAG: hypothetical protein HYW57_04900 [Ignavibacteriales bacterium]|nr:hypothetical protein [Ignavibacteriales bacterium]
MPEPVFSVSFQAMALVFAALAAFGVSFLIYRTTLPPVSRRLRILLTLLRGLGLFFLFLLLGEPVLSLLSHSEEPPTTLVLIDDSRSMSLSDRQGDRSKQLRSFLGSRPFNQLADIGAVRTFLFAADTRALSSFHPDSVTLTGEQTDLAGALRSAKAAASAANIQTIVLISDGNSTTGGSPLLETDGLSLPLFTVGFGDSTEQRDVLIRKILTNAVAYSGSRVPVNVQVMSSGYSGTRVEVVLRQANEVLDKQFVLLEEETREYTVTLAFTPENEGRQQYTVGVSELPDEITHRNNRSTFSLKVLKNKMRVLLLAGGPNPDVAFVRRHLERDQNIDVRILIERDVNRIYDGTLTPELLSQQECVVLVGIPGQNTSTTTLNMILEAAGNGKSVLFIPSRTLDIARLKTLESILPVSVQSASHDEIQAFFHIPETRTSHALFKTSQSSALEDWSKLPPLFKSQTLFRAKPESEVLAVTRIHTAPTQEPFLVLRNINRRKSVAWLGYGLWRWQMLRDRERESLFEALLGNIIRWLTITEDARRIRIEPTAEIFTTQDPVEFSGQIYDESLQPVDDARISIIITGNGERNELRLNPLGNGQYEGRLGPLPAGVYSFSAAVSRDLTPVALERGSFSVGGINAEFLETRTNTLLLRQLAARTGGAFFSPSTADELPATIRSLPGFQPRKTTRANQFDLWNLSWSLGLLLGAFSLEWFIRKRNGML